ncbi:MAG: hypothetical protein HC913_05880 [Microscillaceae bacterium]|nr:hypothetical protein [Microscillaceae bacterium]
MLGLSHFFGQRYPDFSGQNLFLSISPKPFDTLKRYFLIISPVFELKIIKITSHRQALKLGLVHFRFFALILNPYLFGPGLLESIFCE